MRHFNMMSRVWPQQSGPVPGVGLVPLGLQHPAQGWRPQVLCHGWGTVPSSLMAACLLPPSLFAGTICA